MAAIALTAEALKNTMGWKDAIALSNKNDDYIDIVLSEAETAVKGYFKKSNREAEFVTTDEFISQSVMNYACFLLYQRSDNPQVAEGWRRKAFNYMNMVLGSNVSADGTASNRQERAKVGSALSKVGYLTSSMDGF